MRRTSLADADDACAETFLVAWRRVDGIPPPPKTLPYLYGIAGRLLSNQLRTLHRRSRLEKKLGNLAVAPPADPAVLIGIAAAAAIVIGALILFQPRDGVAPAIATDVATAFVEACGTLTLMSRSPTWPTTPTSPTSEGALKVCGST